MISVSDSNKRNDRKRQILGFGAFEVDLHAGELRKQGIKVKLQQKPFRILVKLLEKPGELVTRQELHSRLWPPDVFVDFDRSLTIAVNKLRAALCDSAETPRYIETLSGRGYRFIVPVRLISENDPGPNNVHDDRWSAADANLTNTAPGWALSKKLWLRLALTLAIAVMTVVMAAVLSRSRFFSPVKGSNGELPESVAVLPFKLLNSNQQEEYLGLGLADALITRFSEEGEINVRPIEDVQKYSARMVDPITVGRELRVAAVLDGSVQKDDDKLRITMQLLQVKTGRPLWAEQLDTNFVNVFKVEDIVTNDVAKTLIPELAPSASHRAMSQPTRNVEAYEDYMKGRFYWSRRTADSLGMAIQFFQQAISKDPQYAQAYAGVADSYVLLGFYDFLPPAQSYPKAKQAAMQALALDDRLAEAHASLLSIKTDYDWDWPGADKEFRRAIELNPNYAPAYQWHAYVLLATGQVDGAIADVDRAMQLDPVSPGINISSAWPYYLGRRYDSCIKQCARTLELYPDFVVARQVLAMAFTQRREHAEAMKELRRVQALDPDNAMTPLLFAHLYSISGKREQAEHVLGQVLETRGSDAFKIPAYYVAAVYASLGRKDEAFQWLEQAYEGRSNWLIYLKLDPRFDSLRTDPRFLALLSRIGLPE